jgi:hypothetical protein
LTTKILKAIASRIKLLFWFISTFIKNYGLKLFVKIKDII